MLFGGFCRIWLQVYEVEVALVVLNDVREFWRFFVEFGCRIVRLEPLIDGVLVFCRDGVPSR